MKRLIFAARATDVKSRLESKFKLAGADSVQVELKDEFAKVTLTISNNSKVVYVWYDTNDIKSGQYDTYIHLPWDSQYTVATDGTVSDAVGNVIGEAYVKVPNGKRQRYSKSYHLKSFRTNSADANMSDLKTDSDYADVINKLF